MNEKKKLILLGLFAVCLAARPGIVAAYSIHATVDIGGDNHLVEIDVSTGAITDVGICSISGQPGHSPGLTGLSWHSDGHLYAFDTYGVQIITIDTSTAVGTVVTPVGDDLGG